MLTFDFSEFFDIFVVLTRGNEWLQKDRKVKEKRKVMGETLRGEGYKIGGECYHSFIRIVIKVWDKSTGIFIKVPVYS